MAKGNTAVVAPEPETPAPALKKSTSSTQNMKNQKTLFGFFPKTPHTGSSTSSLPHPPPSVSRKNNELQSRSFSRRHNSSQITPAPSSDALDEDDNTPQAHVSKEGSGSKEGLPSPASSANGDPVEQTPSGAEELTALGTPSRKVSYCRLRQLKIKLMGYRRKRRC